MKLQGMHHLTMITGDAQKNVDFYAGLLGLRMVKKTVNFDAPEAYHLYFGDELGSPGSILTWFEFAGARPGRADPACGGDARSTKGIRARSMSIDSHSSRHSQAQRACAQPGDP